MDSFASISVDGHVATLTLRPPASGVGRDAMEALVAACERLHDLTDQVYAVVVASAGETFGGAWEASLLAEGASPFAPWPGSGTEALAAVPQPTIAAIGGPAHSVGLEIALACDVRICTEDAAFGMPETGLGIVPLSGGTQRLPRAVGRGHAMWMLLTGEDVDAVEALRIGLVSRVLASGQEQQAAQAIARAIAARGPIATRYAKEAVARGMDLPLQQGLRAELDLTVILQSTADRAEGVRAFVERREPRFTGR